VGSAVLVGVAVGVGVAVAMDVSVAEASGVVISTVGVSTVGAATDGVSVVIAGVHVGSGRGVDVVSSGGVGVCVAGSHWLRVGVKVRLSKETCLPS
jgi:hypothetical protein